MNITLKIQLISKLNGQISVFMNVEREVYTHWITNWKPAIFFALFQSLVLIISEVYQNILEIIKYDQFLSCNEMRKEKFIEITPTCDYVLSDKIHQFLCLGKNASWDPYIVISWRSPTSSTTSSPGSYPSKNPESIVPQTSGLPEFSFYSRERENLKIFTS